MNDKSCSRIANSIVEQRIADSMVPKQGEAMLASSTTAACKTNPPESGSELPGDKDRGFVKEYGNVERSRLV